MTCLTISLYTLIDYITLHGGGGGVGGVVRRVSEK